MALGKLLKKEDYLKVSNAVKELEMHTAGEIVPVIAEASSLYLVYVLFYATLFSYITLFALLLFVDNLGIYSVLLGLLFFVVFAFLFKLKCIKYFLIPKKDKQKAVLRLAQKIFFEKGLDKTRDKTGILIYVSIFERKVFVLGDEGINTKIKQSDWDGVVAIILTGIKNNNFVGGLVNGILACKNLLEKYFPIKEDDTNELSNELVVIGEEDLSIY